MFEGCFLFPSRKRGASQRGGRAPRAQRWGLGLNPTALFADLRGLLCCELGAGAGGRGGELVH